MNHAIPCPHGVEVCPILTIGVWGQRPCGVPTVPLPFGQGAAGRNFEGVPRSCPSLSLARVTLRAVSCPHWLQVVCSAVAAAPRFGQTRYVCPFRMTL